MIRPRAVIICDSVIQDRITNQMSLINILEQLRAPAYPLLLPRLVVYAIIERDNLVDDAQIAQGHVTISLDAEVLFEQDIEINFQTSLINRNVLRFQGFVIQRPGTLLARVTVGAQFADSHRIYILAGPIPPPEQLP